VPNIYVKDPDTHTHTHTQLVDCSTRPLKWRVKCRNSAAMYVRFVATGRRRPRELPCTAACLVDYAVYLHCCVWAHVNIAVVWRGGALKRHKR